MFTNIDVSWEIACYHHWGTQNLNINIATADFYQVGEERRSLYLTMPHMCLET